MWRNGSVGACGAPGPGSIAVTVSRQRRDSRKSRHPPYFQKMKLQAAKGMKDLLPEEKIAKNRIVEALTGIFEQFGFNPLETPAIERLDVLSAKYAGGSEILKETFKLKDQGGRDLGLRYDLTVPFSRVVGMNPQLKMPFKRYQIAKVWRDGPMGLGRYREFWQCDVDVVGSKSMVADAEILAMVSIFFKKFNLECEIKINNRKLLNGILDKLKVENPADAILVIDKIEKISEVEFYKEMNEKGVPKATAERILYIFKQEGNNKEVLKKMEEFVESDEGKEGIQELRELNKYARLFGAENIKIDIELARGLAYYTGPIFETFLKDSKITTAVASGGRYDKMIGDFLGGNKKVPATGISFGLDRIYDALKDTAKPLKTVTELFVIPIKTLDESIPICQKLRKDGVSVEIDIMDRGISKNLDYANSMNIPYVVFIGPTELKEGKMKFRDMGSGNEEMLTVQEVVRRVLVTNQ